MKAKIGGSAILAKCLKKEGVDTVFTLSGGHIMSMYYACIDEGIKIVDCRSEANAVIAADAYAKVTGKPGVLMTTAGPGVTNTMTGMLEAMTGRTPIVHIGGACPLVLQGTGDVQDVDNMSLMRACTKWAKQVFATERIADHLDDAFRHAMSGVQGPVYIEIAADILMDVIDEDLADIVPKSRTAAIPYGDPEYVEAAAELLVGAKRPVVVVGNSARYSAEPQDAVRELVEYLDMPLVAATIGRGLFLDEDHTLAKAGLTATLDADVVLALCTANDTPLSKLKPPAYAADAKFIMVSPDSRTIGFNREVEIGIVAGAGPAAKQILEAVKVLTPKINREDRIKELLKRTSEVREKEKEGIFSEAGMVRPGRCAAEVCKFLAEDGKDFTVVADGGDSGCWINRLAVAHRTAQILGLIGNGSVGLAPGTALGAWHGAKKPVLLYTGDGSFGYNFMEFSNYVKYNLPIIVVVANDSAWGMVKGFEWITRPNVYSSYEKDHADSLAVDLPFVHYEKMAQILGGYGELVEVPDEIVPAIKRAIQSGKPAIINVRVEDITKDGYSLRTETMSKGFKMFAKDYV